MRKLLAFAATALMLTSTASLAHFPEGQIFGAWQWPSTHLPNLDGDISEWNVLPDELWIDIFQTEVAEGDIGREIDTANLNFRVAVGWNDELDRVYYVYDRFDDLWDRDAGGFGCCGQDDSIEIFLDADHSADRHAFWTDDYEDAEERARNNGRTNQTGHYRWPALEPFGFYWFWLSSSTWHDKEPYSCCPTSFNLDGAHGTEANFQAEWYTVGWDDFDHNSPENSVLHDFVEGEIIGVGIQVVDNDLGPSADDPRTAKWALGGQPCINGDGACGSDYILLPVMAELLPEQTTSVEGNSWGHIKASFGQ